MKKTGAAILLVEDDADVAEMSGLRLSIAGYTVEVAGDGLSAFRRATQHRLDLVLLDVQRPRVDGVTTLALLRSDSSTRGLPVAMLTNSEDEALRRRATSLGIVDWLVKSQTTPTELSGRISAWTHAGGEVRLH